MQDATIDEVISYWDQHPCNIRRSRAAVGSREFFDDIARNKRRVEPHGARFAAFGDWAGKLVLDAGCGLGTDLVAFADHGAQVIGIDASAVSLELARRNLQTHGLMHRCIELRQADVERLVWGRRPTPDLIWSFGVLHHTPMPRAALQTLRRMAGPETLLRIMLYHANSWKWRIEIRGDAGRSEAALGCPVTFAYSRGQARRLVESAGWRVRNISVEHIFDLRIPDYREGRYVRRTGWRGLPRFAFRAMERTIGWHLLVEAEPR